MGAPSTPEFLAFQEAVAGRYSLERELGRGGMGIVFLAREVRLDRAVALKLLPPVYAVQPALRERFLREARTAARLSHPNIVPIHAVDEVGDFVFFAMAFIEGQTLGQRIRERGPVPPRQAARILREVAWALGYAHAQGVVHRDVKPDNILLEAGTGRALVMDFGIAHVTEGAGVTLTREVIGTAEFMSPEQASGGGVDGRSDLYALGVVGHYMLSGRLPFEGATVAATLAKQITQAAPALASVAPEVPMHLTAAIDRCLAKDPNARFRGGEEMADILGRALEEQREVPSAIRGFMKRNIESSGSIVLLGLSAGVFLSMELTLMRLVGAGGMPLAAILVQAFFIGALAVTPMAMLGQMARKLLASGHDHDELIRALRSDVALRREELAVEYGAAPTRLDAWIRRVGVGSGLVALAGIAGLAFPRGILTPVLDALLSLFAPATITLLGAAFLSAFRYDLRRYLPGERWLKFWESRPGRWLFKLAGLGLRRPSGGSSYRPTEVSIGMAADRLFEELPKDERKAFKELPAVVRALEGHAEAMRARVKELSAALTDLDRETASGRGATLEMSPHLGQKRDSLANDLRATRDAAEARLAEVVAALETIRLGLLRMHAGMGSVEGMTADLGAARELSDDVRRLVEGASEADALLGRTHDERAGDTPTPHAA